MLPHRPSPARDARPLRRGSTACSLRRTRPSWRSSASSEPRCWLAHRHFDVAMLEGDPHRAAEAGAERPARLRRGNGRASATSCGSASNLAQGAARDRARTTRRSSGSSAGARPLPAKSASPRSLWRQTRGKLLARRGELEEGERLAREAVDARRWRRTCSTCTQTRSLDLAEVLALAGRRRAVRSSSRRSRSTSGRATSSWLSARGRTSRRRSRRSDRAPPGAARSGAAAAAHRRRA